MICLASCPEGHRMLGRTVPIICAEADSSSNKETDAKGLTLGKRLDVNYQYIKLEFTEGSHRIKNKTELCYHRSLPKEIIMHFTRVLFALLLALHTHASVTWYEDDREITCEKNTDNEIDYGSCVEGDVPEVCCTIVLTTSFEA